eukprot:TRINITY_DN29976_c0_g1_i1.p1 TRINITY_DN29976_c0_g1~~TRINITY_DN29976_c0_g1_i1.p1  ORF type:complete len:261 (+),score=38.73 TRINITY_DN29976_c0_g1_i1:79-861(+)
MPSPSTPRRTPIRIRPPLTPRPSSAPSGRRGVRARKAPLPKEGEGVYMYSAGTSYDLAVESLVKFMSQRRFFDSKVTAEMARSYLTNLNEIPLEAVLVARAPGVHKPGGEGVSFVQFASLLNLAARIWGITYAESASRLFRWQESTKSRLVRIFDKFTGSFKQGHMTQLELKRFCDHFGLFGRGKLQLGDIDILFMVLGKQHATYGEDGYKLSTLVRTIDYSNFWALLSELARRMHKDPEDFKRLLALKAEILGDIQVLR